jgi:macrolide-specific efflux system membrane fusion protein
MLLRKPIGVARILILVLILLSTACSSNTKSQQNQATPTPIPTSIVPLKPTYPVERGEIIDQLQFSGRVTPVEEHPLYFQTSGRVRNVYFKDGDTVKTGDIIADLEGIDDLQRQLEGNQLNMRRAELQYDMAEKDYAIFLATTPKYTEAYSATLAIQQDQLELAKISLREAQLNTMNLEDVVATSQLVAPIDGVLLSLTVSEGRGVDAYKDVAVVSDVNSLEVSADLSSTDMSRLEEGMQVSGELFGTPGETSTGFIRRLPYPYGGGGNTEVVDQDPSVRIQMDRPIKDLGWGLGDMIKISVVLQEKNDILWLPPQAIRSFEGRKFVVVQQGDLQQRVDVKTGIISTDKVEITDGLEEGQIVVSP